jgi:hypothetical protein
MSPLSWLDRSTGIGRRTPAPAVIVTQLLTQENQHVRSDR